MSYASRVIQEVSLRYSHEPEFCQAVTEVLESLTPYLDAHPELQEQSLLERLVEPERIISFRVPWVDDAGRVRVNRGYRIEFNNALGPYKGGLRFHPSVTQSILKFLGFEQIFKNALTGLPLGGGKGGSDFNPKGCSDREVMAFCQSFVTELYRHIGPNKDVPAGDIGVGGREIGYLVGQYKRIRGEWDGTFTGKGLSFGGSLARTQATGYGAVYFCQELLHDAFNTSLKGAKVNVSGAGNVAIYAAEKLVQQGAQVQTMSDSQGWIYDANGIDVELVKELKEQKRTSLSAYIQAHPHAQYFEGAGVWNIPCDHIFLCATQNELDTAGARVLFENGCKSVVEGANMPVSAQACEYLTQAGVVICPGKAANAGGVAVSGLEMSQNSERVTWSFEEVDSRLQTIMQTIYSNAVQYAKEYDNSRNLIVGANIAGFAKVSEAMMAQGIV